MGGAKRENGAGRTTDQLAVFAIPNVPENNLTAMFAPAGQTLDARIAELTPRARNNETEARVLEFFSHMRRTLDQDAHAALQRRFLSEPPSEPRVGHLKYLDPVVWPEDKLRSALRHGWHERKPMRILDLGAGPGHFEYAARYLGHEVTSTELPELLDGASHRGRFYDGITRVFGCAPRTPLRIEPFQPIGSIVGGGFDLVTAFMATFNEDRDKRPWTNGMWTFFLKDLRANVLKPDGVLFMRLGRQATRPENWSFLAAHASETNEAIMEIRFDSLAWTDALDTPTPPAAG